MDFQLEPIVKEGLHRQSHVFLGRLLRFGLCRDVKPVFYSPAWETVHQSATKFTDIHLVGKDEESDKGLIRRRENSPRRIIGTSPIKRKVRSRRTAGQVLPDGGYIE